MTNQESEGSTFDAIVIGSGISGGWAAKELCMAITARAANHAVRELAQGSL